jgi:hypothetical protein
MSPALAHGKVDRWLLDHEDWIAAGGATRLSLCEDWRKVAVEFGAGHPAATGCLLALVREAWDDPDMFVARRRNPTDTARTWCVESKSGPCTCRGGHWYGATELDAIVAALEASQP